MDIVKYFYEEPAALETLTTAEDPDARRTGVDMGVEMSPIDRVNRGSGWYRGYLAGSTLAPRTVGVTSIAGRGAFVEPVVHVWREDGWHRGDNQGRIFDVAPKSIRSFIADPDDTALLIHGSVADVTSVCTLVTSERRYGLEELKQWLAVANVILFPEPAHDGFDWSFFSAYPIKDRLVRAFRAHPAPGVRRFVLPYQRSRSEERFYFEFWSLDDLPEYVTEIR